MENKENNKITIYELLEGYKKRASDKLKDEYLKAVINITPYISYGTKIVLARDIINVSCLNNKQDVEIDSCKRYVLYIYTLLSNYTNIEMSEKDIFVQYDLLDSNDLLEKILSLIPEKEIATFKTVMEMKQNDLMTNKYETHAYISKKLNDIYPEISKVIMPLVEKLGNKVDSLDEKQIEKAINKALRVIK